MYGILDPRLRQTAKSLPKVITSAWADKTNKKYSRGWQLWLDWCKKYPESIARPALPFYVALFLNELVLDEAKKGRIESAFFGIRWGHLIAGLEAPTDHPFVKLAFEGAKRLVSRRTVKN